MIPSPAEQPARTPVLPGVQAALTEMQPTALDAGAAALAVRYAELMDEAVAAQKYAKAIRVLQNFIDWNIDNVPQQTRRDVMDGWDRITSALAEHTVASDLGPKLLAALDKLELTPASKPRVLEGGTVQGQVTALRTPLEVLRDQQAEQWSR